MGRNELTGSKDLVFDFAFAKQELEVSKEILWNQLHKSMYWESNGMSEYKESTTKPSFY